MLETMAVILDGIVINTVIVKPGDYFDPKYTWVAISGQNPQPGVNWTYDGQNFSPPVGQ